MLTTCPMPIKLKIQKILIRIYLRYTSFLIYLLARLVLNFRRIPPRPENRILIIKPDAAGDYILVRNFLRMIRNSIKYGNYHITLFTNSKSRGVAASYDNDFIDDFIWINKNRIYLDFFYYLRCARRIDRQYSITIHPVFSREFIFDYMVKISGCEHRIGFDGDTVNINSRYLKLANKWYTHLVRVDGSVKFEFEKNRFFFQELLGETINIRRPFIEDHYINAASQVEVPAPFVVLFPGAQLSFRRWPAKYFAALNDYIQVTHGCNVAIAGGPDDVETAEKITSMCKMAPVNLAGKTSFPQLAWLIARARLLVSNDTVAVHIGAAVSTPVVVVSQLNHYGRFIPYPDETGCRMKCVIPGQFESTDPDELHLKFLNGSDVDISLVTVEQVKNAVKLMFESQD